jgi:sugar lactone lactonase YvrE
VGVTRLTAIALACLLALAAGCGSAGTEVSTQVDDATRQGCGQRATLPEGAPPGREFPGALDVKLAVPADALIWRRTLDNVWGDAAMDGGHVWVSVPVSHLLLGIDPHRRQEIARIRLPSAPVALAAGGGRVWAVVQHDELKTSRLVRIDADSGELSGRAAVGTNPVGAAYGAGAVWVADAYSQVYRVDPDSLAVRRIVLPGPPTALAVDGDTVWVATSRGALLAIDGARGRIRRTIRTGLTCNPVALAVSGHVLWVTENLLDAVVPVDATTGKVGAPVQVGDHAEAAALEGDELWVGSWETVTRIDVERRRVRARYHVGALPVAVVADDAGVWALDLVFDRHTELPHLR